MCGRATLTKNESEIEERFGATFYTEDIERYNPIPSFNIVPTHPLPFIGQDDDKHIQMGLWGWNVEFGQETSKLVINARLEEVDLKKTFIPSLYRGRCIIPLDGYYEWIRNDKQKIPYRIILPDGELFSVAGLVREEVDSNGKFVKKLSIVTVKATDDIAFIHDRMPLILTKEEEMTWLDGSFEPDWKQYYSDPGRTIKKKYYKVSERINSVKNNDADLIKQDDSPIYIQQSIFD